MASLSFIVGLIGNLISILVFLSPIGTFRRVVKKKSTENFKGLPYICTLLSTSLWTFYGLLKPGGLLIVTVNGAGAALQAIYVALFLIFAPKATKVKNLTLVAVLNIGFLGLVIAVNLTAIHGSARLTVVGFLCSGLTLSMYASPLSAMRAVIKSKSVEYMPFFLSFFLFLNGGVWSVYSLLVKDFFIGVPNAIGFLLGLTQLVVYMVYKNMSAPPTRSTKMMRGGLEMREYDADETTKERNLSKGRSLPNTTVSRQHSFQKIFKALSLTGYELRSSWPRQDDVENGDAYIV